MGCSRIPLELEEVICGLEDMRPDDL